MQIGDSPYHLNQVYNEDCLQAMKQMPDDFFDLAIVDPPYFAGPNKTGYYGGGFSSLGVKRSGYYEHSGTEHWDVPTAEYFSQLKRVSKDQIIWGANHFVEAFEGNSTAWIVWDKDNGASSFADAELAYTSFGTAVRIFKYMWNGMHQGSFGGDVSLNEKRIHPTQKPTALYKWLLKNYAQPSFKVLDTHLGSASSVLAMIDFGCEFVGFELDKNFYAAARDRINNHIRRPKMDFDQNKPEYKQLTIP